MRGADGVGATVWLTRRDEWARRAAAWGRPSKRGRRAGRRAAGLRRALSVRRARAEGAPALSASHRICCLADRERRSHSSGHGVRCDCGCRPLWRHTVYRRDESDRFYSLVSVPGSHETRDVLSMLMWSRVPSYTQKGLSTRFLRYNTHSLCRVKYSHLASVTLETGRLGLRTHHGHRHR